MPQRLLHLADLHLDRAFAGMGCQGPLARRRRQGLRDALRRAGEIAIDRGCLAVCIGGDLYEHDRAGADTARFLAETFASWQPLRVLIAPGNHDSLVPGNLYSRTTWPENVHIFDTSTLTPLEIADGLVVWGLGHCEPSWQGNPLEGATATGGDVHLALFHGAELGSRPEGKSVHGPFRAEAIRGLGFRAGLSGHYHKRRLDNATGLLYPGSPEPLGFDETGGRGPVIVEIADDGTVGFEALDVNVWSALTLQTEVGTAQSTDAAVDIAQEAVVGAIVGLDPDHTLVRVDLTGDVAAAVSLDIVTVESRLRELTTLATVKVRDLTRPTVDIEDALGERNARGAFARMVTEQLAACTDPAEATILEDALRYGLMALSGAEVGLR